jgi:acyl-CoA synthetase (AMP-forming)/AMP-acid ligase II
MAVPSGTLILSEHEIRSEFARLDDAWASRASVLVLPDRLGVDRAWIDVAIQGLPAQYQSGHVLLLTSGSTGLPKLVIGRKDRAEQLTRTLHEVQASDPVREAILSLPISYSYSFVNQWLWARVHGASLVPTLGLADPSSFVRAIRAARHGMLCLVGVQVPMLLEYLGGEQCPGIIRINFAGGRFPQERLDDLFAVFPNAIVFNNFGCAEAMPRLSARPAHASTDASNIGRPIPGVELRADSGGDLLFRSPFGAVAVLDGANSLMEIGHDEWMATGDQAECCPDGSWRLLGRRSEVFKRYGEKVSLAALMAIVLEHWKGQACFYRERDSRGEDGHVLVLSPAADEAAARDTVRRIAEHYPRAAWPLRIECVDSMPLLSNQKIDSMSLAADRSKRVLWSQRI